MKVMIFNQEFHLQSLFLSFIYINYKLAYVLTICHNRNFTLRIHEKFNYENQITKRFTNFKIYFLLRMQKISQVSILHHLIVSIMLNSLFYQLQVSNKCLF